MSWTKKADWLFIASAAAIWAAGLLLTGWDFFIRRGGAFTLGPTSVTGLACVVGGILARLVARATLGRFFFHGLRLAADHTLIARGIYRRVRHPAYSGLLLFNLGTPLLFGSLYGFLVMLFLIPSVLYRIRIEERMLIERFGTEYTDYMRRTKKLIPSLF